MIKPNKNTIKLINKSETILAINKKLLKKYSDIIIVNSYSISHDYYSNLIMNDKDIQIQVKHGLLSVFKFEKIKIKNILYKIKINLAKIHGTSFNDLYKQRHLYFDNNQGADIKNIFFYTDLNKLNVPNIKLNKRIQNKINNNILKKMKTHKIENPLFAPKKIQNLLIFQ